MLTHISIFSYKSADIFSFCPSKCFNEISSYAWLGPGIASGFCDWLRNKTLLVLILGPAAINEGEGLMQGVEQWLLLRSHWSNNFQSSSGVGPPEESVDKKYGFVKIMYNNFNYDIYVYITKWIILVGQI